MTLVGTERLKRRRRVRGLERSGGGEKKREMKKNKAPLIYGNKSQIIKLFESRKLGFAQRRDFDCSGGRMKMVKKILRCCFHG